MEEKVYFQSEYQYDLSAHKEFNQITMNSMGTAGIMNCLSALCILYLMTAGIGNLAMILLLVLGIFYLATGLLRWYRNRDGGIAYKQILHRNGDAPPRQIVTLTETGIQGFNPVTENQIRDPYGNIRTLMETKNLLILVTDVKMCHILDKRSLSGGSREELIAFLREKCPKLGKSIKTGRFGLVSRYLLLGIVALGVLLSLASLLHIPQLLSGQFTNRMTYAEMAEELQEIGITISQEALTELEGYEDEYNALSSYPKVMDLLILEGMGRYDWDTWEWTPSESGLYWFDLEVMNVDTMYSDFLRGVDYMHRDLAFANVSFNYSQVDFDAGTGRILVSFDYLLQHYELEAVYNYDWFDTDMIYQLGRILAKDQDPRDLWMVSDGGQGILLYYGTEDSKNQLTGKTGIEFMDCVEMRMGH